MIANDTLNSFYQGLVDEDGSLPGDVDDCIDDDGTVDHARCVYDTTGSGR